MNSIVEFNASQVPSFVKKGEVSTIAKALMGSAGGGGKRISIKGGVFRLISDGKEVASIEDRHLDVVVVNAAPKVSRIFYLGKYDEQNPAGPDCWSANGETPDPKAENKQASACADCPQNISGSGEGTSRACRYQQRLAVALANDIHGDVMQLTLPAQSIFGKEEGDNRPLQAYARFLAAQNASPDQVITRLKFDTKAAVPKLFFKAMRWLTEDEYETVQTQGATTAAVNAITMTVAQVDKVEKPAPAEAIAGAPPKAAKKPKSVAVEEEAEEPVKREEKAVGGAVPKKSGNLANIVDQWDETDD
jgi:hypothetical protein